MQRNAIDAVFGVASRLTGETFRQYTNATNQLQAA